MNIGWRESFCDVMYNILLGHRALTEINVRSHGDCVYYAIVLTLLIRATLSSVVGKMVSAHQISSSLGYAAVLRELLFASHFDVTVNDRIA
jgi:hypothetical protein